jgi:hypothetical protein
MSLLFTTLGSWIRIPLEAWMSVHVSSVSVVFSVDSDHERGGSRAQGVLPTVFVIRSSEALIYVYIYFLPSISWLV